MTPERQLDRLEALFRHSYPVFWVKYSGEIDEPIMRKAFTLLAEYYPALRGVILNTGDKFSFSVSNNTPPEFTSLTGTEDDLRNSARYRPHHTRGLSRLILVKGEDSGYVGLQVCHTFFDGPSLVTTLADLWQIYSDLINGSMLMPRDSRSIPAPPSTVMESIWNEEDLAGQNGKSSNSSYEFPDRQEIDSDVFAIEHRAVLSIDETEGLIHASRNIQTSLHQLICGVVLNALRGEMRTTQSTTPMSCISQVDIRNRVVPRIRPMEIGLVTFVINTHLDVRPDDDSVSIAKYIKDHLDTEIPRRLRSDPVQDDKRTRGGAKAPERTCSAFVLNAGAVPKFTHPKNLDTIDFGIITDHMINPNLQRIKIPEFHVYSYDGRLSIIGRFPRDIFTESATTGIVKRYTEDLIAAGKAT